MLTVEGIRRWKPRRPRDELYDHAIPGFCARADKEGKKAQALCVVYTHRPISKRFRYTICPFVLVEKGEIRFDDVRQKALEIWSQARQGRNPAAELKTARAAAKAETAKTFGQMIELYTKRRLSTLRRGRELRLSIDKHLMPHWRDLPMPMITRQHVRERVEVLVDQGHRAAARRTLEIVKAFFAWCVQHDGIVENPAAGLRADVLCGEKRPRDRILSDVEWRALFAALPKLGYPFGPGIELLARTGLRLAEVFGARWSEIDFESTLWSIAPARMKNDQAHLVPLVPEVVAVLKALPRTGSEFLFTTTGRSPVSGFSVLKEKLDRLMQAELGEVKLESWSFHDVRRSCRTAWSSLPIPEGDIVRELMLAHAQPKLHRTYDREAYLPQRREGYRLWQAKLHAILEGPRPDTVVQLRRA